MPSRTARSRRRSRASRSPSKPHWPSVRVLVAGASGFIGRELVARLKADGHTVLTLSRSAPTSENEFLWLPSTLDVDPRAVDGADAVVNLAGASTGRIPWTTSYKREILYSRVQGTQALAEAIGRVAQPPTIFLNGSAVGYYGDRPGEVLTETSTKGAGFLSDVVEAWEQAAHLAPDGTRVVTFRTGVVVGDGGAFTPLIPLTKLGLAARFGSGRQHWPWISLHDEAAAIRHLLTSELDGVVNLVGPTPATSQQITDALANALGRWHPWVIPEFAVNLLGDAGRDLLLMSENVVPERLLADGFAFRDTTAEVAIEQLARAL
ncbi:MAG: TIGR01777 family oxidoreductase [Salinibacterium sp.]|nr:TIGR01777 family oxidoreductase [Salinibacterium sp.]